MPPGFVNQGGGQGVGQGRARVVVGRVDPDDPGGGLYVPPEDDANLMPHYRIYSRYVRDQGVYMAGITSPGGFQGASVAFFQLHAPTLLLVCDWTCLGTGVQPVVPSPLAVDSNWTLLDAWVETVAPTVAADQTTPIYRVTGTYFFGHAAPASDAKFTDDVSFPRYPWLDDVIDRSMPLSKLQDLIFPARGRGGFGPTLPPARPPDFNQGFGPALPPAAPGVP